ncbi:MAG: phage tail protein [Desulfofustis sp.]|nr:phage tail protein [Desulfofustis sp.]
MLFFAAVLSCCGARSSQAGDLPFIGEIIMFAGNYAPEGWALCNGQLLSISQYSALYSILGTMYGGNGTTTFALPDLRGRMPLGPGSGPGLTPRTQGWIGGSENATLTASNIPAHTHPATAAINVSSSEGTSASPVGNVLAKSGDGRPDYSSSAGSQMAAGAISVTVGSSGAGGSPFPIIPPVQVINFIIALDGIYPIRQ